MSDSEISSTLNSLLMNQVLPLLSHDDDNVINRVLNRSFIENTTPYKQVISDEGKKTLKTITFKESKKLNDTCPIFQEDFKDDDLVTELPCGHLFIPYAISRWLEKENPVCPVCRFKFDSVEKRVAPRVTPRRRISRPRETESTINEGELQRLVTTQPRRRQLPSYVRPPSPPIFYDPINYYSEEVPPLPIRHRILPEIPTTPPTYTQPTRRPLVTPPPTRHLNYNSRIESEMPLRYASDMFPRIRNNSNNRFRMFQNTDVSRITRTTDQRDIEAALRRTRR